ncbi:RNA polymerase sigma factor [Actinoplanes teichomyceticus]|uniref:RNA polymerase sigma factor SigS n=1 Tax=Actinoplanes teichomyceticus TaxID=1867 RepID=A0A561VM06_ACTTI|nr:sigma-70 family RNA polymerase sigma factor [Actinoplanes teichomyceticus]TWG12646.1 RNA polymerase sigma-70 factor (ECF subfamily) [Actinoplanes teichomyceticus]GIF13378.1 hypothetical protein Ate01nite_34100 [Actinoplanes teichomyceticus]
MPRLTTADHTPVPSGPPVRSGQHRWDLLAPHHGRLVRIARRRLPNPHDAEDCAQEALIRAACATTLPTEHVGRILTTIVIRLCIDHCRARTTGDRVLARIGAAEQHLPSFEEAVCDRAEAVWIRERLDGLLTGRQLAVLQARADGLSTRQAAGRLNITHKSAEAALTAARARVRRLVSAAAENL